MSAPHWESLQATGIEDAICPAGWELERLSSVEELAPLLEDVAASMATLGYPQKDVFSVRLALEEALVNSIKHGHHYDPTKQVVVRYRIDRKQVMLEIEDQGEGFDPPNVPDPTAVENLERSCGRGLFLMRSYTTWMRYNGRGNRLTLCKRHSEAHT